MATFKAVVFAHHKREDGTYRVSIRITHNRKAKYLPTNIYVTKLDLKKDFSIKSQTIIETTNEIIDEYKESIKSIEAFLKYMSVEELVNHIDSALKAKYEEKHTSLDFTDFANSLILQMKNEGRFGSAKNYECMLRSINNFYNRPQFKDINIFFLNNYKLFLKKNNVGERGISLYLGEIRTVFYKAIETLNQEELGIVKIPYNPFTRFKIEKQRISNKRALSIEQ